MIYKKQSANARDALLKWLKPGDKVYTKLLHVSRSGMSRTIQVIAIQHNELRYLTWNVALLLDTPYDQNRDGLKVNGCGSDAGYDTIYNMGRALFKEFICLGEHCPSNDHANGDPNYKPHPHSDPGYALRHSWL